MVRCRRAVLAAAACLGESACDSTRPLPPAVLVVPATLTLEDRQTSKITATLRNPPKSRSVRWSSTNTAVATVDLVGTVTAVANGPANILVKMVDDSTVFATVPVTVTGPAVATVTVSPPVATAYVGFSFRMSTQLRAADGRIISGRAITYTSPDATIADVSSTGLVRGRAPGGPIAVTATSEGRSATTLVRVAHVAERCPFINTLTFGLRHDGRLAPGDCEYSLDESYVDVYEVTLAAAATIQVDMVSADVDSYIGLFESTGAFLGEDDNSGGGRNAQLVKQLSAGKYRIWANTTSGGVTGAYALTVSQR